MSREKRIEAMYADLGLPPPLRSPIPTPPPPPSPVRRQESFQMWDHHVQNAGHHFREPHGTMPVEEAMRRVDPVFDPWEKFQRNEHSYIAGLADHIQQRGFAKPITLDPLVNHRGQRTHYATDPEVDEYIYDGHHRLAAAQFAGIKEIPYYRRKWVEDTLQ